MCHIAQAASGDHVSCGAPDVAATAALASAPRIRPSCKVAQMHSEPHTRTLAKYRRQQRCSAPRMSPEAM